MISVFDEWAAAWGLPDVAVSDLIARLTRLDNDEPDGKSEAAVQADCVRAAAQRGDMVLWRNNSGAFTDDRGRLIRFGLGHVSAQSIKRMKSADLIGIWRRRIEQADVGSVIGQFIGPEVKRPDWKPSASSERDRAQAMWAATVSAMGGIALRVTSAQQILEIKA